MEPELESLQQQFTAIRADADQLVAGLSDAQLTWSSQPGSWSMAECFAHLVTVHLKEIDTLKRTIAEGRMKGRVGKGPFRYSFVSKWFVKSMEPPVSRKFKVPKVYAPPSQPEPRKVMEDFRKTLIEMQQTVNDADGLDLGRIKVTNAVTKLVSMNLGARLALFAAHDRRHLAQARSVRNSAGFPA